MKERTRAFIISLGFGAILTVVVYLFSNPPGAGFVQRLCDGFFISGILLAGSGGLVFVRNEGLFDIFGYGVKSLFGIRFLWMPSQPDEKETYAEYKERKRKRRKSPVGLLIAGTVYLFLSFVLLLIYLCLES